MNRDGIGYLSIASLILDLIPINISAILFCPFPACRFFWSKLSDPYSDGIESVSKVTKSRNNIAEAS